LRQFLHPVDPHEIIRAADANVRLYRKTDRAAAFGRLLTWERLNTLITADALMSGRVSMARQGRTLPLEMVGGARGAKGGDWLASDAIQNLCHQGLSLVLNNLEKDIPEIAAMTAMVERNFRSDTITNAYASFNRDSAFKAHLDPHHVLILQLHGRKRWWCYGQLAASPTVARAFEAGDLPAPEWVGVLEPGDILFIPRGDVHRALVEDSNSLHLTVTMTPPCGADILQHLSRAALRDEVARHYLPINAYEQHKRETELKALFHRLVESLDIAGFFNDSDRVRPSFRPFNLSLSQELAPTTEVQPALRRKVALGRSDGADVRVEIGGAVFTLSACERNVLAVLLEEDALTIGQLVIMLPSSNVHAAVENLARKALVFLFPR
jgi:hypothetical protein